jgi:hypothetical protein
MDPMAAIDLYWLPLGAGGHVVRLNGRLYEYAAARRAHREPRELYHAALEVWREGVRHVIEMAPVWSGPRTDRGVVLEGPVGARLLGRSRWFRYEVRRWPGGVIPDADEAVGGPRRIAEDGVAAAQVLGACERAPRLVWGRDELRLGEMWNSNSLVAWLLATSGVDLAGVEPPDHGRAPGWDAGLSLAARRWGG